jgi:hypothetical protein
MEYDETFVFDLMAQTESHDQWLAVVRFGLPTLIDKPELLIDIIAAEACRQAEKVPSHKASDHAGSIFAELGLKLSLRDTP